MRVISSSEEPKEVLADSWLDELSFHFPLRKYQQEIIDLCNQKLEAGEKELHIVAPPGAGKTILGLEIVSQFKCPSLVLCPNTTIQSQWSKKLDHFISPNDLEFARHELLGGHKDKPLKPITVMTYQALCVADREAEYLNKLATNSWIEELKKFNSLSRAQAEIRILDLQKNNKKAYKKEISRHGSRLRRKLVDVLELEEVLHENSIELVQAIKRRDIGLVIFDECHHLTDFWAAVMIHLVRRLDSAVIVGLTGTPPTDKSSKQKNRYLSLVGEIDYQVPTPALVKEGGLAPYQDLVYFTEPLTKEFQFLANSHKDIHNLLEELSSKDDSGTVFSKYIEKSFSSDWSTMIEDRPELAMAMSRFLYSNKVSLPRDIALSESNMQSPLLSDWIVLLEDYALNQLKISDKDSDKELYKRISKAVKQIGFSLSERGIRKVASKVDRVLAYSKSKVNAIEHILSTEYMNLDQNLRAVIVCDFEKMSATTLKPLQGILDPNAGGAIGTLKTLQEKDIANELNPCLVTGSRLLVDNRIIDQFMVRAREYLKENNIEIELSYKDLNELNACQINGNASSWNSRVYVSLITNLFSSGLTKCLIGTRGILGEGWDCQELNTIIDLTTSTSSVSVKQLRGRGIRINTQDAHASKKVANNWDVVCIAPSLEKGLNDYNRFVKKHDGYFGIADDGQIECGVGHVHPSFSDLTPLEVFANFDEFNYDMLKRALMKDQVYNLWQVGRPYANKQIGCVEIVKSKNQEQSFSLLLEDSMNYPEHVEKFKESLSSGRKDFLFLGCVSTTLVGLGLFFTSLPLVFMLVPMILSLVLGEKDRKSMISKLEEELRQGTSVESLYRNIAKALLSALKERNFLPEQISEESISITKRKDNSYRIFLDKAEASHSNLFIECFEELVEPISNQNYLLPRYEFDKEEVNKDSFVTDYINGEIEPRIGGYYAVPKLLARSRKGRDSMEYFWQKYVSHGYVISTQENPDLLIEYLGSGPRLSTRKLWA